MKRELRAVAGMELRAVAGMHPACRALRVAGRSRCDARPPAIAGEPEPSALFLMFWMTGHVVMNLGG